MIAIEITAAVDAAGTLQTFYLTTKAGGFTTGPTDTPPNTFFEPRIVDAGRIGIHAFSDGRTGGASKLEVGEIVVANTDGSLDGWINYSFDGRPVKIRGSMSDAGAYPASFPIIFSGTSEGIEAPFSSIVVKLRDKQFVLDKPVLASRYAGTNALPAGREGVAADLKGKAKPKAYGKVFNVAPPMVNTSRLIYETGPVASVDGVYDRGLALTAGAAYASIADLEANAPAAGQYRVFPAGGYFRLGSSPAGQITADLSQGAAAANRTAAQIIKQLALDAGLSAGEVDAGDVAALDALTAAVVGIWVEGESTFRATMDRIAASVGAFYAFDGAGVLRMGRLSAPAGPAVVTLDTYDYKKNIQRKAPRDNGIPIWRATVKHSRIWTVQGTDLAGAVAADRRGFLSQETRAEQAADATIKTQWLLAGEAEFDGLLTTSADATTEAARLLALHKVRRDVFEVPVPISFIMDNALKMVDVIELRGPRFGLAPGRLFRMIGFRIELARNQALLTLWG